MLRALVLRAGFLALLLRASAACADDAAASPPAEPGTSASAEPTQAASSTSPWSFVPRSIWLDPGVYSYHFDRNAGYREDNWGFGAQVNFAEDLGLLGGTFLNSDNRRTYYAGVLWQPLALGPIRLGAAAGAFDGYPLERNGGWFPAALPMASVAAGPVGLNLSVVPNYKNRLHGAVVLELLLKVW